MAYEPFALKYRPRTFTDLVGQEAVTATLENALASDRVANAFLFSGSRGVGKTSAARILAGALNCTPSEDDEMAAAIFRGEDVDVIEIDGASNRGIDEIRAIRDNAGYAPARARHKIYIIDEVHMLTIQAFNALLKTLEEPPPHVKFIFATTELQAVPETIVSRCQCYEFRRISLGDIVGRLRYICGEEGVTAGDDVLEEIARRSEGGLRDSISLLEQAVAFAGETVTLEDLDRTLGRIDGALLEGLVVGMGEGDCARVLDALDEVFETGRDPEDVLGQLLEVLREAMVREARGLEGGGEGRRASLVAQTRERFDLERLLFALRIGLNTRREMKSGGMGRVQLEVALLKVARSRDLLPLDELLKRLEGDLPAEGGPAPGGARSAGAPGSGTRAAPGEGRPRWSPPEKGQAEPAPDRPAARPEADPAPPAAVPASPPAPPTPPTLDRVRGEWGRMLAEIRDSSPRVGAFLEGGVPSEITGSRLKILLPAGQTFALKQLEKDGVATVRRIVDAHFGAGLLQPFFEVCEGGEQDSVTKPRTTVYEDRDVRKLIDGFDGSVLSVENEDGS